MKSFVVLLIAFIKYANGAAGLNCYKFMSVRMSDDKTKLKSVYKKMAAKMHPDRNRDNPEATNDFQKLAWCHDMFQSDKKRDQYHRCGEACVNKGDSQNRRNMFFSNGEDDEKKGDLVTVPVGLTLEEVYFGKTIKFERAKKIIVETGGTRDCRCRNEQQMQRTNMGFRMITRKVCDKCKNEKLISETETMEVEFPPGCPDNHSVKFYAEGEPLSDGEPGDLEFVLMTFPHPVFQRRGENLYTNLTISLYDSLTSFSYDIDVFDRKLTVKRERPTTDGFKILYKNFGMPYGDTYNDKEAIGFLIVTIEIEMPRFMYNKKDQEKLKEVLYDEEFVSSTFNGIHYKSKKLDKNGPATGKIEVHEVHENEP